MKKTIFTIMILTVLGIGGQSCQTSSNLEEISLEQEKATPSTIGEDKKDKPGGN